MNALIIDGSRKSAESVSRMLKKVRIASDFVDATDIGLEHTLSGIYDIVIIDSAAPKAGAMSFIGQIRSMMLSTPIIVISDKCSPSEKARTLDCGADDFIVRPIDGDELIARIRAVLRRSPEIVRRDLITVGDVTLNMLTYEISGNGCSERLGAKEMGFAELLFRAGQSIVPKEDMILKVWGYDSDAEYNNVEVYISLLRKKLRKISKSIDINTIRGVGYRLG